MAETISVIIPVYNVAPELRRCLDSILAQTYPHIEIIAVDDGSTDGSGVILDQYAGAYPGKVRVIHKENGGVTSARLRGVQEAAGQWIGFVDGDDCIEPDMYGRLLANALAHNAQISHCGYQMIFPDGRIHYFHNTGRFVRHDRITALRELLSGAMIEPGLCNKLFHKVLLDGLSMPMDITINEDLLMNFFLFSKAETSVYDDWCPYRYITRGSSASHVKQNPHKIHDPIRVRQIILDNAPDALKTDAQRALVRAWTYSYCALVLEPESTLSDVKRQLRGELIAHRDWIRLLPRRTRLMAILIMYTPWLFAPAYRFYIRFLWKDKYS